MVKRIAILFVFLLLNFAAFSQTKINCYSETGRLLGYTYLETGKDIANVYDEHGYLMGQIRKGSLPYRYYDLKGIVKADVYIDNSGQRCVFIYRRDK
jgi:hypothetical protein